MKWLKLAGILTVLAAFVLVLIVAGVATSLALGNTAWLKAELAKAVHEQWQRTLTVEGALELSFWPDLGFQVGKARLSEPDGSRTFAAIAGARLSVAPWPLLERRIVVQSCELEGLDIALNRSKDGRLNVADLLPGATTGKEVSHGAPWQIDIAALRLADARLAWHDEQAGQTTSLSALTLTTGRIVGDSAGRAFHVDTPRLAARLDGDTRSASVRVTTAGIGAVDGQWTIAGLDFEMDAHVGASTLAARLASAITVDPAKRRLSLDDITGRIDIAHPKLPTRSLTLPIAGRLAGDLSGPSANGALSSRLDGSDMALRFAAARFAPLSLTFALDIDHLDLDKYLARDKGGDDGRIDLAALKDLDIRGDLRIGRLRLGRVTAANITLAFDAAAGVLELTPRAMSGDTARRDGGKRPGRPAGH